MSAKQIWRRARKILAYHLPDDIALRDMEDQEDYGLDTELEVILDGEQPSGTVFKAQLKGSRKLRVSGGRVRFGGLRVDRARYALGYRLPVVFFVVDTTNELVYWLVAQLSDAFRTAVGDAEAAGQMTMTVELPVENLLHGSFDRLLNTVADARGRITLEAFTTTEARDMSLHTLTDQDLERAAAEVREQASFVELETFERMHARGEHAAVLERAKVLLDSPRESALVKMHSGLEMIRSIIRMGWLEGHRVQPVRDYATAMMLAACRPRTVDVSLQRQTLLLRRWHRFATLAEHLGTIATAAELQGLRGEGSMWSAMTRVQAQTMTETLVRELDKLYRDFGRLLRGVPHAAPRAWVVIAPDAAQALQALRRLGQHHVAARVLEWAEAARDAALSVALQLKRWDDARMTCVSSVSLGWVGQEINKEAFDWARTALGAVRSEHQRREGLDELARIEEAMNNLRKQRQAGGNPSPAAMQMMTRKAARLYGVDLDNPRNELDRTIRTQLDDFGEQRHLQHCRNLRMRSGYGGATGELFGLPSQYEMTCRLPGRGGSQAMRLSDAFDSFVARNCTGCLDKAAPEATETGEAPSAPEGGGR